MVKFVPNAGDLVWLEFDPQKGNAQFIDRISNASFEEVMAKFQVLLPVKK